MQRLCPFWKWGWAGGGLTAEREGSWWAWGCTRGTAWIWGISVWWKCVPRSGLTLTTGGLIHMTPSPLSQEDPFPTQPCPFCLYGPLLTCPGVFVPGAEGGSRYPTQWRSRVSSLSLTYQGKRCFRTLVCILHTFSPQHKEFKIPHPSYHKTASQGLNRLL